EVVGHLNVVEMMMALQKMRARRTPANQAHVTNWKEHPALLAADAAEAAWRGFAEEETTVRVARNAPLNALAILIGSQTGRGGALPHDGQGSRKPGCAERLRELHRPPRRAARRLPRRAGREPAGLAAGAGGRLG